MVPGTHTTKPQTRPGLQSPTQGVVANTRQAVAPADRRRWSGGGGSGGGSSGWPVADPAALSKSLSILPSGGSGSGGRGECVNGFPNSRRVGCLEAKCVHQEWRKALCMPHFHQSNGVVTRSTSPECWPSQILQRLPGGLWSWVRLGTGVRARNGGTSDSPCPAAARFHTNAQGWTPRSTGMRI